MASELYGTNKISITQVRYKKFCKKSMPDPCFHLRRVSWSFIYKEQTTKHLFGKKQWNENQTYLPQLVMVRM